MSTLAKLRGFLLAIFVFGSLGTAVELLLLEHTEDLWQKSPLVLLAVGAVAAGWHFVDRRVRSARVLQVTMVLFIVNGLLGLFLHYDGNAQFELEMTPALSGMDLFREAMAGATPALAPGTMIQLGLLGLACTYGTDRGNAESGIRNAE